MTFLARDGKVRIGDNSGNGYGTQIVLGTSEIEEKLTVVTGNGYGLLHTNGTQGVGDICKFKWWMVRTKSNHSLHLFTNDGSSAMTVTTGNNVGVGTTTPTTKFEVAGNSNITGLLTANKAGLGGAGAASAHT